MSTLWFAGLVLASSPVSQAAARSHDTLLAEVPERMEVSEDYVWRSGRGGAVSRSTLVWSADGRTVAYAGVRGDEWFPVVGAKVGESYAGVSMPVIAGGHVFFHVGRTKAEYTEEHWLWVDGKTVGPEDMMGPLGVSPDGKHVAYWTWPGAHVGNGPPSPAWSQRLAIASEGKNDHWSVKRSEKWNDSNLVPPLFTADGERAFTCANGKQGWVVLEMSGKRESELSDPHPRIDAIASSRNGVLAFVRSDFVYGDVALVPAASEHAELYFKGKRIGAKYVGITEPTVDARGEHIACAIALDKGRTVAVDGETEPQGRFDYVSQIAFAPLCQRLAFIANRGGRRAESGAGAFAGGKWFVVVRPLEPPITLDVRAESLDVRDLVWDASGQKLAYCARGDDGWRVVCGSQSSDPHDDVGVPQFAADGRSLGFGTRDGRVLWWRVIELE